MLAPNLDIAANIFLGNEGAAGLLAPLPPRGDEQEGGRAPGARRPGDLRPPPRSAR